MTSLRISDLTIRANQTVLVDSASTQLNAGELVVLLGPNGAGKTTTLSMLLGLLLPTEGTVHVFGVNMLRNRYDVLHRINFTSPYVDLPQRLSVEENLIVYARLYGLRGARRRC